MYGGVKVVKMFTRRKSRNSAKKRPQKFLSFWSLCFYITLQFLTNLLRGVERQSLAHDHGTPYT